ncbi:heme lyase CcmF/NrfE family subunit [Gammaproteobacteria bacterium]|nr:heme lyase CcmF/NrfE family subunit [Gammaproteobacteria bacterium]MDC1123652.1 heme lyase CcmF/NrfE family subunit [Gammaproteobacteria bacterium]
MIADISHYLSILSTAIFMLTFSLVLVLDRSAAHSTLLIKRSYSHAFFLFLISFLLYVYLALTDNFSVSYIAQHSNSLLPNFYKVTSIWSAHEGSMFLWIVFLSLWGFVFNLYNDNNLNVKNLSIGIISIIIVGFQLFLLVTSNPFEIVLPFAPENGADINPVLQDPALAIHPPTLYLGYVGFVIPFAYSLAFLINGNKSLNWEKKVKSWSVMAWVFLTIGISLGSWWAYYELGWGGYWFWDPVENVALMPWLAATAFIHSLSVASKSNVLRIWNLLLSIIVFSLSLFGAFIVRSGIIDSIHSFANDPQRGMYLLAFIAIILFVSLGLFISRFSMFDSSKNIKSLSKESFISLNNIFFGVLIFSTMMGITYPLIYELLYSQKISVGAPFYNAIYAPITILATVMLVVSIDSKWGRTIDIKGSFSMLYVSLAISLVGLVTIRYFIGEMPFIIMLSFFMGLVIIFRYSILVISNFIHKKYTNIPSVLAHTGLGLLILSISANSILSSEKVFNMKPNETRSFQNITVRFSELELLNNSNHDSIRATFSINSEGKSFFLSPEKRKYFARGQITSETAIKIMPFKDIYLTIGEQLDNGQWVVNVQLNYFIRFIWLSAAMMALSGLVIIKNIIRTKA